MRTVELREEERKERPIRRVLRHKHSREYFTGCGWTMDLEEARTFQNSLEAAHASAQCGLSEVELVLRIKGGMADLYCTEVR